MTCAHFGQGQICTQVDASFSPFGHPTQVNARWVTSIILLLVNEIQDMSALRWFFFATHVYLRGNLRVRLATQRKSLRKFNLRPLATTCHSVWPGLYTLINLESMNPKRVRPKTSNQVYCAMRTLKFKAQPTNVCFATFNQMFGGSSQSPTSTERTIIQSFSTVQTKIQCSRKLGGAAEHSIDASEIRICPSSFEF